MSMMSGFGRSPETGETIASFRDYDEAQKAVSKLIESEVPARDIVIVGSALRSVERVTGRLGWAQAAWSGALNGVLLGLLLGALVLIWSPALPMGAFAGLLLLGVAMGMVFRLANYLVVRRRRDFASVMQVTADHYEVAVQRASAGRARQLLGAVPSAAPVRVDPAALTEPPRFGVRVDPRTGEPLATPRPPEAPVGETAPAGETTPPSDGEAVPSGESEHSGSDAPSPGEEGSSPEADAPSSEGQAPEGEGRGLRP